MEYIKQRADFKIENNTVLTLGKFDGVHKGHKKLIHTMKVEAEKNNLKTAIFTFSITPKFAISDDKYRLLTTKEEKKSIFESENVDYLIEFPFTKETATMKPEEFIKNIIKGMINAKIVVVGTDFCFGHNREGNINTLTKFQEKYDYKLIVVEKDKYGDGDISSTLVRDFLKKGDIKIVNKLINGNFVIREKVIHGNELGRKMNIPTINMRVDDTKLLPPNGVYSSFVIIDGKKYKSITNIGYKPTVKEKQKILGVETHILDFSGDLYDKIISVYLTDRIRDEKKFASLLELTEQMNNDIQKTKLIDI